MKPDDIPQWAWDEADDTTYNIETDGHGSIEYTEARASIARLVMKARSQAYAECAKIADEANDMARREFELDARDGPFTLQGSMATSKYISQAIRQHSQKGEDK